MADYERSSSVEASPAAAFGFLAEPSNLPTYIAFMTQAMPSGGGLHVAAQVQGRHEEGDATFSVDAASHRVEWGRRGSEYRGWLQVAPDRVDGQSSITIHIHTGGNDDAAEIERAIADSLANIRAAAPRM